MSGDPQIRRQQAPGPLEGARSKSSMVERVRQSVSSKDRKQSLIERVDAQRARLEAAVKRLEAEAEALAREREEVRREKARLARIAGRGAKGAEAGSEGQGGEKEEEGDRKVRESKSEWCYPEPRQGGGSSRLEGIMGGADTGKPQEGEGAPPSQAGAAQGEALPAVVELRVGDDVLSLPRAALCQVKGSLLASMFDGGCWPPEGLTPDAQGRPQLDFNPQCLGLLLHALATLHRGASRGHVTLVGVEEDMVGYMKALVSYLGLDPVVYSEDDPESLVNKRVDVFWTRYERHYPGVISSFDAATQTHEVTYDDGDVRRYDLNVLDWRFERPCICWVRSCGAGGVVAALRRRRRSGRARLSPLGSTSTSTSPSASTSTTSSPPTTPAGSSLGSCPLVTVRWAPGTLGEVAGAPLAAVRVARSRERQSC